MVQYTGRPVIDFTEYIVERTKGFTGREWVFQTVNDWITNLNGSRYFLLTGEPGSGKTAIASRLAQFSYGIVAPTAGLTHLTPNFLSALHLCSARDRRWINPYVFTESLAIQLAERYPAYALALAEQCGDRHIHIEVQQHIEQGQAIGVIISRLDVGGASPEDVFNRLVREPLEILFRSGFDQQVVILVDALDEALGYSGNVTIISLLAPLDKLPSGVRFILISRPDLYVEHAFLGAEELVLSAAEYEPHNQDDIRQYVHNRLSEDRELAEKAAQVEPASGAQIVEIVSHKAEGNFLYVRFFLDAIAKGLRLLTELEGLPEGLDALYSESLDRVVSLKKGDWHNGYAPLIGMLSVAQESPTLAQLQSFTGQPETTVLKQLDDLWQFIEGIKPANTGETCYRLYHQSMIHFLHSQSLFMEKKELRNTFYLPADEWHKALANWCERGNLAAIWEDTELNLVEQGRRVYVRQYYIIHLYLAREWQQLFAALDEGEYGRAKMQDDPSTGSYAQDLGLGRQAAAWRGWTLDEGFRLLPNLWRYTLLQCSLTSRADEYPPLAFRLLMLLGKEREALNLAELLTNPVRKTETLLDIASVVGKQPNREQQLTQILLRACEVANTIEAGTRSKVEMLCQIRSALADAGEKEKAKLMGREVETAISALTDEIFDPFRGMEILLEIAEQLEKQIDQGQQRTEILLRVCKVASTLKIGGKRQVEVLCELASALADAGEKEKAKAVWGEAQAVAKITKDCQEKVSMLLTLGLTLAVIEEKWEVIWHRISNEDLTKDYWKILGNVLIEIQTWAWIKAETDALDKIPWRVYLLSILGLSLSHAGELVRAGAVWTEVEAIMGMMDKSEERIFALGGLARALVAAQQWERAESVINMLEKGAEREESSFEWGFALIKAQRWGQAETVINMMEATPIKVAILAELAKSKMHLADCDQSNLIWAEAEGMAKTLQNRDHKAIALHNLSMALAQIQQWEQAERVVGMMEKDAHKTETLGELVKAFAQAKQWEHAERIIATIAKWSTIRIETLPYLYRALIQDHQWKHAESVIATIEDDWRKGEALLELGVGLSEAQQWEQAEKITHAFPKEDRRKAQALSRLGITLAQAGEWEHAETVLKEIRSVIGVLAEDEERAKALHKFGKVLLDAHQWEHAEEVIRSIEIERSLQRQEALAELGIALAQAGKWERGEIVIGIIEDSWKKAEAFAELVEVLAQVQQWEQAVSVINAMEWGPHLADALGNLAKALVHAEQWEQARNMWTEAEAMINTLWDENNWERVWALGSLVKRLAEVQDWERIEAVISTLKWDDQKAWLLGDLAELRAQNEDWERAETIVGMIKEGAVWKEEALSKLSKIAAQQLQWERAETLIGSMKRNEVRGEALTEMIESLANAGEWEKLEVVLGRLESDRGGTKDLHPLVQIMLEKHDGWKLGQLGKALARSQQWERAEEIISNIESSLERAQALSELSKSLAQARQWKKALMIIERIGKAKEKVEVLCTLGQYLVEARQRKRAENVWSEAELVICTTEDGKNKVESLTKLAEALANAGEYERLLRLVQRLWAQADARNYAIQLLPLATRLLPLDFGIGTAFCKAFTWVDAFL